MNRSTALLATLAIFAGACDQGSPTETPATPPMATVGVPTVVSTAPVQGRLDFPRVHIITAHFSEVMDSSTINASTFTLQDGGILIPAVVAYSGNRASLTTVRRLNVGTLYTATITTGARSLLGVNLATAVVWTFTTVTGTAGGPATINLGTAANYVILAKSGVSTTGTTSIVGDLGLSPAAGTLYTGFAQSAFTTFSTSPLVTGQMFAANFDAPTPATLITAIHDMQTAYSNAAGRGLPDYLDLGAGNIQGLTLVPGLYRWGTGVSIPSAVTLTGGVNDVWIFQVAGNLTVGNGAIVTLTGGAQAKNVFWQVSGAATLGTTAQFQGIILSKTLISMNTGAQMTGRAFAQTAVTLIANAITHP